MKKTLLILVAAIIIGIIFFFYRRSALAPTDSNSVKTISYTGTDAALMIKVISPKPGDIITSPLVITGEARGPWYFEGSFPVVLTNGDGLVIANGHAEAKGNWMVTDFVPFEVTLTFIKPANAAAFGNRTTLIMKNDNPSGESSRDKAAEIPLIFK